MWQRETSPVARREGGLDIATILGSDGTGMEGSSLLCPAFFLLSPAQKRWEPGTEWERGSQGCQQLNEQGRQRCLGLQSPTHHTPGGMGQKPLGTKGWSLPGCSQASCQEFRPHWAGLSKGKPMTHNQEVGGIDRAEERWGESETLPASLPWRPPGRGEGGHRPDGQAAS